MVQQKKTSPSLTDGSPKAVTPSMSFPKKDSSNLRTMAGKGDTSAHNGSSAGFRTDAAISSGRPGTERVLQRWMPDSTDSFEGGLESTSSAGWDQFAVNEQKFGIKTDYDENYYTTRIDTNAPNFNKRMAAADKKAREIERSTASTSHVAEERKMDFAGGDDGGENEEDKYSGVKRQQDFPPLPGSRENKYTPPARRAPTSASTVKGAPVDPAIISSQLKPAKGGQPSAKSEDSKARTAPNDTSTARSAPKATEAKSDAPQKLGDNKAVNQNSTPMRPSAATSRTISPHAKEGVAPSATSTVERDVLKEFKTFANQQRINAERVRSTKARADKEVKLTELKKFADSFKLPTPVPVDLISIIAKDPVKQREIQERAQRDAAELAKRKAEEAVAKEKKATVTKEGQPANAVPGAPADRARPSGTSANAQPGISARHPGGRQSFMPQPYYHANNRGGPQQMGQSSRLVQRIRNAENHKVGVDMRQPPTGPANAGDPSFGRRIGGMPNHMGAKLNPNSHEFRPSPFAASFSPNGHPSAASSPRSAMNNPTDVHVGPTSSPVSVVIITKKRKAVDPKKCVIMDHIKTIPVPQGKNWDDNDGIRPSFDTPPTWRQIQDDEKPDSTMHLSYAQYFERQPFATQPTPNPSHVMPQLAHQYQLPLHLQHGAHSVGPRHSPQVAPAQMHPVQHGAVPHPFNGADDHRMMHSSSSQSFSSPRLSQVPMAYPPNMTSPAQMPYNQVPAFMPATPHMAQFNRSFSNNPQYGPQQGMPMMLPPQFMPAPGMPAPQMAMYPPGSHQFMPPNGGPPPQMSGINGYPSPGRPAAPLMVHQGSQQGQPIYGMSPGMQPAFPQQPGQQANNNMRGYHNPGPQYGSSPQQIHQYGPQYRNNSSNYKNYQGHNQHHGQNNHHVPTGPPGRAPDGPDEAK